MKRAYVDIPEGQMHYRWEGEGESLLLLHAAVTSSAEYNRLIPYLSKSYRAIAIDCLGAGESDPAPCEYSILDHTRTIISFMDALGIEKANVMGQFNGAMVATELAVNWPERVSKLVIAGTGFWEETEAKALNEPDRFTARNELQADGSHLTEWWRRAGMFGEYPTELIEERVLEYVKAGPRGEEMHWAGAAYDLKPRLPLIQCPTLVLDATYYLFHYLAQDVADLIPNGKLTTIENGNMYLVRAMPKEAAEAVLDFLNSPAE